MVSYLFITEVKLTLVGIWALRLGSFLWKARIAREIKDKRYEKYLQKFKPKTLIKDLVVLGIYVSQGFAVLITSSPLYFLFKN